MGGFTYFFIGSPVKASPFFSLVVVVAPFIIVGPVGPPVVVLPFIGSPVEASPFFSLDALLASPAFPVGVVTPFIMMMKSLGMVLIGAAAIAFLVPRLPGLRVECARPVAIALLGGNPGREVAVECLGAVPIA